jgi:hypothetical protein
MYFMGEYEIRVVNVPLSTLRAFLESVAAHPHQDIASVAAFAGFSETTGKRALQGLAALGLVERDTSGLFTCTVETVTRGMTQDAGNLVLRRGLLGYRPFAALCEGLALGEGRRDAIRKAARLLGIPSRHEAAFDILIKWALELGILTEIDLDLQLAAEVAVAPTTLPPVLREEDVESEAKARLYNALRLGQGANNYLDEIDRQLLADALLLHSSKPTDSVEKSGQALEDFLREVARTHGVGAEAAKASGAGQLASLLVGKGVLHTHHQKLVDAIYTARNATAHRKDRKTLAPWEITPFGGFWALSGTLVTIRSIFMFVNQGSQTI